MPGEHLRIHRAPVSPNADRYRKSHVRQRPRCGPLRSPTSTHRNPDDQGTRKWLDDVRVCLEQDGFTLDKEGKISWPNPPVLVRGLSTLSGVSGITIELERIRRDLTTDPHGAIGAANQLIEATAKTALGELNIEVDSLGPRYPGRSTRVAPGACSPR